MTALKLIAAVIALLGAWAASRTALSPMRGEPKLGWKTMVNRSLVLQLLLIALLLLLTTILPPILTFFNPGKK
jgi:hypothetical protein